MASKKKNIDQGSLFFGSALQTKLDEVKREIDETVALAKTEPAPPPDAPERPKLRLVPPQPDEDVTIEPDDSGFFWVSFVRHDGTTRGAVRITKRQVEMLIARAPIALEMSK